MERATQVNVCKGPADENKQARLGGGLEMDQDHSRVERRIRKSGYVMLGDFSEKCCFSGWLPLRRRDMS